MDHLDMFSIYFFNLQKTKDYNYSVLCNYLTCGIQKVTKERTTKTLIDTDNRMVATRGN